MALSDSQRLEAALVVSPLSMLVLGVLSRLFPVGSFRELFAAHAPNQWDRKLAIHALTWLMLEVATGSRRSVHAAYRADAASAIPALEASPQALYQKFSRLEPSYSTAVVRASAQRCAAILGAATQGVPTLFGWEGYRVRIVDGMDLDGTDHRLGVLRQSRAAGLPARFVVCYELASGLITDVVAAEDAYDSERVLVRAIFDHAQPSDLYVCDRFYCTADLIFRLCEAKAFFVIRHFDRIRYRVLKDLGRRGRAGTGEVSEQVVAVEHVETGDVQRLRLLTLTLDTPTRAGETAIRILTNLPRVAATRVCELYRTRWTIEGHFSHLKTELNGEIASLGQPRAAIFATCMAMVAANALAVVKWALREAHGAECLNQISGYYLTEELARNACAVDELVGEAGWDKVTNRSASAFWSWCQEVAAKIPIRAFEKNKARGPKRPQPKPLSGKKRPHYSTQRLIEEKRKK